MRVAAAIATSGTTRNHRHPSLAPKVAGKNVCWTASGCVMPCLLPYPPPPTHLIWSARRLRVCPGSSLRCMGLYAGDPLWHCLCLIWCCCRCLCGAVWLAGGLRAIGPAGSDLSARNCCEGHQASTDQSRL